MRHTFLGGHTEIECPGQLTGARISSAMSEKFQKEAEKLHGCLLSPEILPAPQNIEDRSTSVTKFTPKDGIDPR
jgi:hypothetical protein